MTGFPDNRYQNIHNYKQEKNMKSPDRHWYLVKDQETSLIKIEGGKNQL